MAGRRVIPPPQHELDRMLQQLAVEAAGVGVFDWELATGTLTWDDRLLDLFGYRRSEFGGTIEDFHSRLHPDDRPRVTRALQEAIAGVGEYAAQYRIVLPDGSLRWIGARGRALPGPDGRAARLIGAAYDTTAHRDGEARVAEVLEAMPAAFVSLDEQWRVAYVNAAAERALGRSREDLVGVEVWESVPAVRGSAFERNARLAVDENRPVSFEAYYPEPLKGWYEVRAWPSGTGLSIYFLEVTERREAQERAAAAAARAALLADVNEELGSTLDAEEAVGRLARLMAPRLADWSLVTLVTGERGRDWRRGLRDLGWWHADPERLPLVAGYARTRLESLGDDSPLAVALREGRPQVIDRRALERFLASLADGPARDYMTRLAPESAAVIPLLGRNGTVGLLSLYNGPDRPPLDRQGLDTVLDAAARAGLALDNARLYAQQRRVAEELQRSLLTAPPQPDGVRVAVRYEAAAEAAQVGGDWYDAFLQPDGATVLVIGDVVGHDTAAAAAMGQVRGLLRGIAAHTGDGPAAVLRGVDEVLRVLQIDVTATAVVARIERDGGGTTRLRWSNAGHPPPLVVGPEGAVAAPPARSADLLLGVDPGWPRTEDEFVLEPGATALLYTDGLVERRGQTLDEGLTRLRETLADLAGLPLEQLCDAVLARLLPSRLEDDVAMVALRLDDRADQPGRSPVATGRPGSVAHCDQEPG